MKKLALQHLFRQLDRFGTANGSSISQSLQLAARKHLLPANRGKNSTWIAFPFRIRLSTPLQSKLQRRLGQLFSPPFANASFLNAPQRSPSGAFPPLRLGSGGRRSPPRLGRELRTAPVSRQTKPKPVCHSPRFHSHPATFTSLRSVSFTVPSVFVRWRSSEGQKQAGNGRKEKTMKLEENQQPHQGCSQLSRRGSGVRAE